MAGVCRIVQRAWWLDGVSTQCICIRNVLRFRKTGWNAELIGPLWPSSSGRNGCAETVPVEGICKICLKRAQTRFDSKINADVEHKVQLLEHRPEREISGGPWIIDRFPES
jgi:hypothetical protein